MEFLKKIEWTPVNLLKAALILLVALMVLSFALRTFDLTGDGMFKGENGFSLSAPGAMPAHERAAYDMDDSYGYAEESSVKLSANNIGIPAPQPGGSVGGDSEDYEVKSYSASIETNRSFEVCNEVEELKALEHVVFENSNEYEQGCNYTFKVESERASEVLEVIESLNPTDLSESAYTIKRQLDDFTSETEILERKLAVVDETLEKAVVAYDEITVLATRTQDVESLAKVIDSKINTIERLTQQRINIVAQLERLSRSKAEQLDRLVYTYFNVHVYENKFVDGESIKESWKGAVKKFVRDINGTAQDVTINLVAFFFMLLQYILYFFILLFIAKFVWKAAQGIWKK